MRANHGIEIVVLVAVALARAVRVRRAERQCYGKDAQRALHPHAAGRQMDGALDPQRARPAGLMACGPPDLRLLRDDMS
jgi:hypothetical protein